MATLLKDIPSGPLTPDEVEALANQEFDFADKERVSLRAARQKIRKDLDDTINRSNLLEINRVFGLNLDVPEPVYGQGTLIKNPAEDFTFKEKAFEIGRAIQRGAGSIVKIPGVALKALGEIAPTRAEVAELEALPFNYPTLYRGPAGKAVRSTADLLRRTGNKYIEFVNGMMLDESRESRFVRQQSFLSAPFYRTLATVGESGPSYGVAVATTLTTGNPNLGLLVLGTTTASSAYEGLREQGVDPDLAVVGAVLEGSIEMLTEKVPMDILLKGSGRPFLVRALRLGTAESFQELFAQMGQNYVEAVAKGTDPENLASVTKVARQQWSVISQGWEDAMSAGFLMGTGATVFTTNPFKARSPQEMLAEYGVSPRTSNELIYMMGQIQQKVKDVEAVEAEPPAEVAEEVKPTEAAPVALEAASPTDELPPEPKKSLLDNLTLEERSELDGLEKQFTDKIKNQFNIGLDPEAFILATKIGTLYVKAGYRSFRDWAAQVRARIGNIPDFTLRTVYSALREQFPDLDTDADIDTLLEVGTGEEKPRGTSVSVMAQAIEDEMVEDNKTSFDELPTYRAMNMAEQSRKALAVIEDDIERAKRIAFYQEAAPLDLFPENIFSALRTYAKMKLDIDLLMDLALKEDVVREHTTLGKRIKSLDTNQDIADPVRAIKEVVEARKDRMARKGKDVLSLEVKLRELQAEVDISKRNLEVSKRKARRAYGNKNTLVTRVEYESIIARRKKENAQLRHDPRLGAVYVPNPQDFVDIGKIGLFHLEAMGRDFAKWSYQMTKDFGEWITPHLQDEYDKVLKEAAKQDVEIKESKRLTAKKKRLATVTKKTEQRLAEQDLEQIPRIPIELDEEGRELQAKYDTARAAFKAAQAVANIITEEEVRIIAQLAKDAADRKAKMEKSERRKEGKPATVTELEYGIAISMFLEYVNDLKIEANKRTMKEVIKDYLVNPVDFVSDFAGTLKTVKASLDNSFVLRQGLPTFLKAITGHVPSAKIWWNTFIRSWKVMWNTLRKRKVMRGLFAEMISDPDYELLKQSKVALNVIEEEIPVDIPSRIPLLGILFRMGENAFVASSRYMRYQLAKQYINVWRKSGIELNKKQLESIGKLANSQTGRGDIASRSQKPGLLNNLFWSPRNLRASIDILTLHLFDHNFSAFARRQAALNLLRYISGAAMILAIGKWVDDDSVTWDTNSSDLGKIIVGATRFSVGGGLAVLIVLASRLVTRKFTSATTGKTRTIDSRRFGAIGGKELVWNFLENKLSPAAQLALSLIDQITWEGDELTIPQMVDNSLTPLTIQSGVEAGNVDDAANILAVLIAETVGVNVQTFAPKKKSVKQRSRI